MALERLQKVLSRASVASRRKAERLIAQGRVTVNGQVAAVGQMVDPERDEICVDGRLLGRVRFYYYAFHKPEGVVTTLHDPQGRPCLGDLLRGLPARLYPVGRLDYDSSGLLILTNDGALAHRLMHPRFGVRKRYHAEVEGLPSPGALARLRDGVLLSDGPARAEAVRLLERRGDRALVGVEVSEGRKREVRRMLAAVGHPVRRLVRVAEGPVELGDLPPGGWRPLTRRELRELGLPERQEEEAHERR
ncbi:MAG: rRNA pseudouridine synthase [Firmicutes bacterium]|nr:rRNA pseudouridine synthase [Bacillota bacterium]